MAHVLRSLSHHPKERTVQFERFSTDSYPRQQRQGAWRDLLQQHHLRPEGDADPASLFGTLVAGRTGHGIELTRIASSPQTLSRLGDDSGGLWLCVHLAGEAVLCDGGRELPLAPGDIVYGPATAAPGLLFRSNFRQFMVSMPTRTLAARRSVGLPREVGRLSGRTGMGRMFAGTLTALSESFDSMGEHELAPIESTLAEFIASTLTAGEPKATAAVAGRSGLNPSQTAAMARVQQHIETQLSDPALTLSAVARHEHVSPRLLQKLFEGSESTFSSHLRQRRLERCRADLANRLYGHLSISDICYRWGFNDPAHFSHAFRDRYQVSPSQYRQQAADANQRTLQRTIQRGWPAGYREPAPIGETGSPPPPNEPAWQRPGSTEESLPVQVCPEPGPAVSARPMPPTEQLRVTGGEIAPSAPPAARAVGRHHYLGANDKTVHWGYFSRTIAPVLTIASGDFVTIETLTQHAYDDHERMIKGDSGAESVFHWTKERKNVSRRGAGPVDASIFGRGSGEGFGVHICTGPIRVQDAAPGDVLEVRIVDLMPRLSANAKYQGRAFGSNAAAWWGFHYDELLTEPKPREVVTIYEIDVGEDASSVDAERDPPGCSPGGCAHAVYSFRWTPQRDPDGVLHPTIDYPGVPIDRSSIVENHGVLKNVRIPTRPHFGVIAVAPVESGFVDSIPPAYFGGNIDNWRIAKGATVYLRVGVAGALLSVGDPHASQGDSELCGTAIECSLTGVFQVVLHKAADLGNEPYADIDYPLVETADEWVLHGFSHPDYLKELGAEARSEIYKKSSLDLAMRDAFRKTRRFLMTAKGLTEDEAISLMSVAVDFGVTQVVDGNWGVHAVIRKALFRD